MPGARRRLISSPPKRPSCFKFYSVDGAGGDCRIWCTRKYISTCRVFWYTGTLFTYAIFTQLPVHNSAEKWVSLFTAACIEGDCELATASRRRRDATMHALIKSDKKTDTYRKRIGIIENNVILRWWINPCTGVWSVSNEYPGNEDVNAMFVYPLKLKNIAEIH